jgi:hypothetical protein
MVWPGVGVRGAPGRLYVNSGQKTYWIMRVPQTYDYYTRLMAGAA